MISHEDKNSLNVAPIPVSRADIKSHFYSKVDLWTKCFNGANGHRIFIICYVERKMMTKRRSVWL